MRSLQPRGVWGRALPAGSGAGAEALGRGQETTESGWGREKESGGGEQSPNDGGGLAFRGSWNGTTGRQRGQGLKRFPGVTAVVEGNEVTADS